MQVWNVLHAARWKCRTQKLAKKSPFAHHRKLCRAISSQLRHVSTIRKKVVKQQYLLQMFLQYFLVNFSLLAAEINPVVWGTPAIFHGFRIFAALKHGTPVLGVSQTLRRWTEAWRHLYSTGRHNAGHWPTFLVLIYFLLASLTSVPEHSVTL